MRIGYLKKFSVLCLVGFLGFLFSSCVGHNKNSDKNMQDPSIDIANGKLYFISYGNQKFRKALERICKEAGITKWFDGIDGHSPDSIQDFMAQNKSFIETHPRGGGYWIWKPYIIRQKLEKMNEGDYLLYLDSGFTINANGKGRFQEYIHMMNTNHTPMLVVQLQLLEKCWTKGDVFEYFKTRITDEVKNSGQIQSGLMIIKKTQKTLEFVREWESAMFAKDFHLIDDTASIHSNDACFKENRHDQSVFSTLLKIYGIATLIPDETFPQNGKDMSKIPFIATRKTN